MANVYIFNFETDNDALLAFSYENTMTNHNKLLKLNTFFTSLEIIAFKC